jgi:hypothetical protein
MGPGRLPPVPVSLAAPEGSARRLTFRTVGEARAYTDKSGLPFLRTLGMVHIVERVNRFGEVEYEVWIDPVTE